MGKKKNTGSGACRRRARSLAVSTECLFSTPLTAELRGRLPTSLNNVLHAHLVKQVHCFDMYSMSSLVMCHL